MHKAEDFTLEQIQKHLRIENESRMRDKKEKGEADLKSNVYNVESGSNNNRPNRPNNKRS